MTDFGIRVKIDPGDAKPEIKSLQDAVDSLEKAGKNAGTAMATGMREGSTAAAGAAQSAKEAANQDAQWNMMLAEGNKLKAAEADMLARINGPLDKRVSGQEALNSLLAKGAINASDYANQMDRLDAAVAKSSGPQFGPSASQAGPSGAGESGGGLGSPRGMIAGLASIAMFKQAASAVMDLSDRYAEESNAALRLTDSTHSVNDVLTEQIALGEQYKTSTTSMIDLTAKSRQALADLNLTSRDRASIEKGVYDMVRLQGESTDAASAFMVKYGFAVEKGGFQLKEFQGILREYPDLLARIKDGTGKSAEELIAMQKAGTDMTKVMLPFLSETADQAQKSGQILESVGDQVGHLKDKIALDSRQDFKNWGDGYGIVRDGIASLKTPLEDLGGWLTNTKKVTADLQQQMGLKQDFDTFVGMIKNAAEEVAKLAHVEPPAVDPMVAKWKAGFQKVEDTVLTLKKVIVDTSNDIEGLMMDKAQGKDVTAQLALDHDMLGKAQKDLAASTKKLTGPLSEYAKLSEEIDKRNRTQAEGLVAVQKLYDQGRMSLSEYNAERQKYINMGGAEFASIGQNLLTDRTSGTDAQIALNPFASGRQQSFLNTGLNDDQVGPLQEGHERQTLTAFTVAGDQLVTSLKKTFLDMSDALDPSKAFQDPHAKSSFDLGGDHVSDSTADREATNKLQAQEAELYKSLQPAMAKYQDDFDKITKLHAAGVLVGDHYTTDLENLKAKYLGLEDPQVTYAKGVAEINKAAVDLGATTEEQAKALDNYAKKMGEARDVAAGFRDGLTEIEKEMKTGAAAAGTKVITDGFHSINDAIVSLATTGTADWSKMIDSMIADLARLALQSAEMNLFGLISGAGGGAIGGGISGAITSPTQLAGGDGLSGVITSPGQLAGAGESYHVPGSGGSGGAPTVIVQLQRDDRALQSTMKGRAGAAITAAHVRENPRAYQRLLGRR